MTLLQEIQEAAFDPNHSLAYLLRKCLVLSYRLDHQDFRDWVERELNGYPKDAALPMYRVARGDINAALSGPFQGLVPSVPVPLSQIPDDAQELLRDFSFRHSVAL